MQPTLSPEPEECEKYCTEMQEGMQPVRDPGRWTAVMPPQRDYDTNVAFITLCNRKDVYEDTDDM